MDTIRSEITLTINGARRTLSVGADESLLAALHVASYFSVTYGCGNGDCGVCTVLMNGKPVRSWVVCAC